MAEAERFWVIDFDRCLGDTLALYNLFTTIMQEQSIVSAEQLAAGRHEVEQSGGSFDILSYLFQTGLMREDAFSAIATSYQARAAEVPGDTLMDGARDFLRALEAAKQPFGIMSYGSPRWQNLKIAASGLEGVPRMIVGDARKGRDIAKWYHPDAARFSIPEDLAKGELSAREVVLVDDKATAFTGLPEQARGYWLQLSSSLLASQKGNVPGNVTIVRSFAEMMSV